MLYRYFIGSNNKTGELEKEKAIEIITKDFKGFTLSEAFGYWEGKPEKSLIVDIETQNEGLATYLAQELAYQLKQDAVGLARVGELSFIRA